MYLTIVYNIYILISKNRFQLLHARSAIHHLHVTCVIQMGQRCLILMSFLTKIILNALVIDFINLICTLHSQIPVYYRLGVWIQALYKYLQKVSGRKKVTDPQLIVERVQFD